VQARNYAKDYLQFLYIARGSLAEVESLLSLSLKLGYIDDKSYENVSVIRDEAAKTLYGLVTAVATEIK